MNSNKNKDNIFPWYDSIWLSDYVRAKRLIETDYSDKYLEFVDAFEPLRTRSNFETMTIENIFDDKTFTQIEDSIATLSTAELEREELLKFGRLVVHDNAYFTQLHHQITPLVSELVGESVEPSYNFLSLYNNLGICRVHMDAPYAKYTLDLCIDRSHPWPIYFSQVRDWPEDFDHRSNWEQSIETDPKNIFTAHNLSPRQAAIFSGSSQWHYRKRIPQQTDNNFHHLLFFHFMPKGMAKMIDPRNWATLFNLPELSRLWD